LASAIFALHPVMVESVAWITEQKNTLSLVFYLAALLAYLNFDELRTRPRYLLSLGLFILALLTKTSTVTLPLAILIIMWWKRGTLSWRRDLLPLVPFIAFAAAAGVVTSWVERNFLGSESIDYSPSIVNTFLVAGRAVWFYIGKLVWPANLIPIYASWEIDPSVWCQWIFPVAVLGLTVGLWLARNKSRSPLAAWLFFCVTLFPVLGGFKVAYFLYTFVADHFVYIASLGIITFVASCAAQILARLPSTARAAGNALCVALLAALALLTMRQNRLYTDTTTFYKATIDRNPDCWIAHHNLAMAQFAAGDQQQAIEQIEESLRLKPDYAPAEYNLARFLAETGQTAQAYDHFRAALRLHPEYYKAHISFGSLLVRTGQTDEAIAQFQAAVAIKPDDPIARNNLAVALIKAGRLPEAVEQIEHALPFDPNNSDAHTHLGIALALSGKVGPAIEQYGRALELNPDNLTARHNLGVLLAKSGKTAEAIEQFQLELRLDPNNVGAYSSIAEALAVAGRSQEALRAAQKAIEVARSTGQADLATQMEAKLKNFQAALGRDAENPPKPSAPNR
jgi:tetratricopeptide (TPR) repeat protein